MKPHRGVVVAVFVVLLLQAPAVVALTGPSHTASAGVVYETNSGLEVTTGDEREIGAVPFDDDQTFATESVAIESPGPASARITDQTFADSGDTMTVRDIDATQNPVTVSRSDLDSDITVEDGTASIIAHNVTLDDNSTDLEVAATSEVNITVESVTDTEGIQAVDTSGTLVAGETDTSDGTVTLNLEAGSYQLRLQDGPSTLTVRDLTTQDAITDDNISVRVEFFGSEGAVAERTADSTGTIDMTGLPADERFSVSVDTNNSSYVQRQILIPSLLDQQSAYLLPQDTSIETVEPRFVLEDPSNQFDAERSEIVLSRPLDTANGTEFVAVTGDRVGLNGFDTILERDQRYRVTVTDPDSGARRQLGEFTPTQSEQVTLTVQDVEFDSVSETEGVEWTARYLSNEDSVDEVEFIYRDEQPTESLSYQIVERGNDSNVLAGGTASGNVTVTEPVPPGEENTVWEVTFEATREDGQTISATRPVSTSRLPVGPTLDPRWQTAVSMLGLFAVAGLFGAANPGVGAISVAATGGMFFFLGWLPDSTGGIMVLLALFVAVLAYVGRRARGATT
jgi:predicted lipoprotein